MLSKTLFIAIITLAIYFKLKKRKPTSEPITESTEPQDYYIIYKLKGERKSSIVKSCQDEFEAIETWSNSADMAAKWIKVMPAPQGARI